jgi:hypothetical protein
MNLVLDIHNRGFERLFDKFVEGRRKKCPEVCCTSFH